ncbi:MAG TPA: hypothetical protein VME46_19530 [Acidimicrobiales bacterium]|nr:hypothetical protein [Acidimicrobiales bacterium]
MRQLHPEVPGALRRLRDHGFRLFTLTDNTSEISGRQLERGGVIGADPGGHVYLRRLGGERRRDRPAGGLEPGDHPRHPAIDNDDGPLHQDLADVYADSAAAGTRYHQHHDARAVTTLPTGRMSALRRGPSSFSAPRLMSSPAGGPSACPRRAC